MTLPAGPNLSRYTELRWNTPLAIDHASLLLESLQLGAATELLDLGCGWGELLVRAVAAGGRVTTGVGVDNDEQVLARARTLATTRGLDGRVRFVCAESAAWDQPADRVLCVGASHAWSGGVEQALPALARLIRPGGRVLFGEGCWERPPTAAAAAMFGQGVLAMADVVRLARATGWQVLHLSTTDLRERDDFEASWRRGRQRWLLDHPDDDRAGEVQHTLDAQLQDYIQVYRGVLGFAYLVLG